MPDDMHAADAAHPSGEPEADAELQRPAAAALANLCSEVSLAERLVEANGMEALSALSESQDRQVQVPLPWGVVVNSSVALNDPVTEPAVVIGKQMCYFACSAVAAVSLAVIITMAGL